MKKMQSRNQRNNSRKLAIQITQFHNQNTTRKNAHAESKKLRIQIQKKT